MSLKTFQAYVVEKAEEYRKAKDRKRQGERQGDGDRRDQKRAKVSVTKKEGKLRTAIPTSDDLDSFGGESSSYGQHSRYQSSTDESSD